MPNVDFTPVTSNTSGELYGASWASIFSIEFESQVWQEWYQAYGMGFGVFDWLTIAGQTVDVKARSITSFTDQALERPILLGAELSTGAAGAATGFTIAAAEWLSSGTTVTPHVEVGQTVFVDPQYTNKDVPTQFQITSIGTYNAGTPTAGSIKAFDSTVQITSACPSGTYLMVGPYKTGVRGGQPGPRSAAATSASFATAILAKNGEIAGGLNAIETYRKTRDKSGKAVLFNKMQVETEFLLNADMDKELFLGQVNSNSLTSTAKGSTTTATLGTKGLWHHVDDSGMELEYANDFSVDHFDSIKDYLRTQGVTDTEVSYLVGSSLLRNIENNVLGFVKEYSGGTDYTDGMGAVGANVRTFLKNGIKSNLCEIVSFDNANSYGVMDDYFRNAGLIVPMSQATVTSGDILQSAGKKVKLPNVAIGYLKGNGEDRERMIGFEAGVNGMGLPFTNEWDAVEYQIKSEFMLVANLVNQMIKVHKSGTY